MQSSMCAQYSLKIENFLPEEEVSEYEEVSEILCSYLKNALFRIDKKNSNKNRLVCNDMVKTATNNIIAPYDRTDAIGFVIYDTLTSFGLRKTEEDKVLLKKMDKVYKLGK